MIVAFAILIYAIALAMVIRHHGETGIPAWASRLDSTGFRAAPVVAIIAVLVLFTA
jgi:hypothetical protein